MFAQDQAAGLRRMLGQSGVPVLAVMSSSTAGRTTVVANSAACLAELGQRVLVIDENFGPADVAAHYGCQLAVDALDAVQLRLPAAAVRLSLADGISLLPAARLRRHFNQLSSVERQRLSALLEGALREADWVLVDTGGHGLSPLALAADQRLLVSGAGTRALTQCYAMLKQMLPACGGEGFRVMVNAARSPLDGDPRLVNLMSTARDHLGINLPSPVILPSVAALRAEGRLPFVLRSPRSVYGQILRKAVGNWRQALPRDAGQGFVQQLLRVRGLATPVAAGAA